MPNLIEIQNLSLPELQPYVCTSERRLYRYCEPEPGLFIAESPKVIERALAAGYQPVSLLVEKRLAERQAREIIERCGQVPVYTAEAEVLVQLTGYNLTQGVLAAMKRRPLLSAEEVCRDAWRVAVLEDVVNQTNIGAVFRSAAALGFDAVLLTPGCCDPLYRRAIRVSMGTVFQIPWAYLREEVSDAKEVPLYIEQLKRLGFAAAAMALRDDTTGLDDPRLLEEERLALILGTEGEGLREETIRACDYTVKIPMAHGVDSLNVAAASAVAFWQLGRGTRQKRETQI